MLYAKLDDNGNIIDVATRQSAEYALLVAPNDPIVAKLLEAKISDDDTQGILKSSDSEMMRVLEDLIDLLTEKRLIQFTELPLAAQKKLLSRKWVRKLHSQDDGLIDELSNDNNHDSLI